MSDEVWIPKMKGRTLFIKIRLFTDKIAEGGDGYVKPRHAWLKGDVSFMPNEPHGLKTIGDDPIMFNGAEGVIPAIYKAAKAQGVTIFDPKSREQLAP